MVCCCACIRTGNSYWLFANVFGPDHPTDIIGAAITGAGGAHGFRTKRTHGLEKNVLPSRVSSPLQPDYIKLKGAKAIVGMTVENRNPAAATEHKNNPLTVNLANITELGYVTAKRIVQGTGKVNESVNSRKGGMALKNK